MIILDIPYSPVSWKAPKFAKGITYDPMHKDKSNIRTLILSQYKDDIIDDPVSVDFKFYFTPPKRTSKKNMPLHYSNRIPCLRRMDCTNMQKLFEDCLQDTVIENDNQVVRISSSKLWDSKEHVLIIIKPLIE